MELRERVAALLFVLFQLESHPVMLMIALQLTALGLGAIVLQACTHYVLRPWVLSRIRHSQEARRPVLVGVLGLLEFLQTAAFIVMLSVAIAIFLTLISDLVSIQVAALAASKDLGRLPSAIVGALHSVGNVLSGLSVAGLLALTLGLAAVAYVQRKRQYAEVTEESRKRRIEELKNAAEFGEFPPRAPNEELKGFARIVGEIDAFIDAEKESQSPETGRETKITTLERARDTIIERFIDEDLERRVSNIKIEPAELLTSTGSREPLMRRLSFIANRQLLGAIQGRSFAAFLGAIYLVFGASLVAFSENLHQHNLASEIENGTTIQGATLSQGAPVVGSDADRLDRAVVPTQPGGGKVAQKATRAERKREQEVARQAAEAERQRKQVEASRAVVAKLQREEGMEGGGVSAQHKTDVARPHKKGSGPWLLAEGAKLMKEGDVAGARRLFEKVANKGLAKGALGAGTTYDPVSLAAAGITDIKPDPQMAIRWYRRAYELAQ